MPDETANAQRFSELKDRLIAVTGSPGLTSFHDGKVHVTLDEWERLIGSIEEARNELQSRELHHFEEEQISANAQATLDEARRLCGGVEYRGPGKHETWDAYHEGRSALADEVEQVLDRADPPRAATYERINTALNRAADEVLETTCDDGDEHLRDAVNLVVNAGIYFLEHPDDSLEDAVRENYDDESAKELLDYLR
ncbi:hypothetical protein [Arthrobacter bambusae]|uniref:ElaB/YqjD/DUF883 family membrane-anchored ribosome-binding protein n=1 Tax=Arthrobacter bambusae TaxID=1338426 RepID=A0AAW8DDB3_9MICC|nr:hypothetical protein [Arthrobacter bambusae]MDP9903159.1 ElaB/YqjD/DUF883 family membrane-anchored ribosome-binding protein [Arthrobacter bambusae]MDQ0128847.1 ElaB/YqjD/DUF883 family membrane-anchored ribosome-binding protein [Arthrobacter bambusae]MDQ0180188.1 ElaB/YqjD/DUF883 family membrane-anchored ribosome-binding protein [Arthrobacter bambusae]